VRDELARYFKSPSSYEMALKARLVDHLIRRARDCLETGNQPVALELLDRVLAIDPNNAQVTEILARLGKKRRARTYALIAIGVLGTAGGAWALRHAVTGGGGEAAVPDATTIASGEPADAMPIGAAPDAAPAVIVDAGPRRTIDALEADPETGSGKGTGTGVRKRPDAGVPLDAAAASFVVRLNLSPKDSEYSLDGSAWRSLPGGSGDVSIPGGGAVISVRNEVCCEAEERTVRPEDAGQTVAVNLGFLPARVIPHCERDGVRVQVEGRPVNLDKPVSIPFGDTTSSTRKVKVEFITAESIDEQVVTVKYAAEEEVTCQFD